MADTNQIRRADVADFSQDDPFAELMRIMGGEPRQAASADDEFDIDLEKELAGGLDFAEFDETPAAPEKPAVAEVAPEAPAASAEPVAAEDEDIDPDVALEAAFDDAFAYRADSIPAAMQNRPVTLKVVSPEPESKPESGPEVDEDFTAALEHELLLQDEPAGQDLPEQELTEQEPADDLAAVARDVAAVEDDLHLIEAELAAVAEATVQADAAPTPPFDEPVAEDAPARFAEVEASEDDERYTADVDMDFSFLEEEDQPEPPAETVAETPVAETPMADNPGPDDPAAGYADDGYDDFTSSPVAEIEPVAYQPDEDEAVVFADEPRFDPTPAAAAQPASASLEDELTALLAGNDFEPAAHAAEPAAASVESAGWADPAPEPEWDEPVAEAGEWTQPAAVEDGWGEPAVDETGWVEPAAEETLSGDEVAWAQVAAEDTSAPAADPWRPMVNTFGRANFAALRPAVVEEAAFEPEMEEPAVSAAPAVMLDDEDFAEIFADEPDQEPDFEIEDEPAPVAQTQEQPSPSVTGFEALAALASWQPGRAAASEAPHASAAASPADEPVSFTPAPAAMAAASTVDAYETAVPEAPATNFGAVDAPEVETVEVSESAFAVVDDLDIPDVDYGAPEPSPAPALYDDLEGEIAQAFGDLSIEEPAPVAPPQPAFDAGRVAWDPAPQHGAYDAAPAEHYGYAGVHDGLSPNTDAGSDNQWQPIDDELAGIDFNYEDDLEQAIAMSTYEEDEAAPAEPRKRGLFIAAIVAGIAIVGGVGAYGMSWFGGGPQGPALVMADTEPLKVRPENPGGTVVPNQDSQAYQRVSGGAADAAPEQERLISTVEEPVDLAARSVDQPLLAPGIGDDTEALAAAEDDAAKIEDRIPPAADDGSALASADNAPLVAPRRVRTMIVRPDGTLVPNEDPPVAAETQPEPEAETILSAAPLLRSDAPATETAAEDDGGPVVEMPDTVAVVPTRRVEPQSPAPATNPAPVQAVQQPAAQAPAATPVSAPAAAAPAGAVGSEWSMQIASQPTAEGAQSAYQDLARRYGNVLEGRGVNIVRADIEGRGTYYRVRIPASSRDEAIQLCTRYKAAGGSCFVSR